MLLAQGRRKLRLLCKTVVCSVEPLRQGPAILAHASQLEAQFQNILSSPCYPHMDPHTHVLSQEGLSSCPQHDICTISHSSVDSGPWGLWAHARVVTKKPPGPSFRNLGGRRGNACWLPFPLRLVRCKSEPVQFSFDPHSAFFLFLFFFARRYWHAMAPVSQFLCCGWRILGMNDVGELCPKSEEVLQRSVRFCSWAALCSVRWVQMDHLEAHWFLHCECKQSTS